MSLREIIRGDIDAFIEDISVSINGPSGKKIAEVEVPDGNGHDAKASDLDNSCGAVYLFYYPGDKDYSEENRSVNLPSDCKGKFLKIGKVGPRSGARYTSQHYTLPEKGSTLAKSLYGKSGVCQKKCKEWIKDNTVRINIVIRSSENPRFIG